MAEIKLIVVGVDGSDGSRAALEWAYDEAAHHDAVLTVVNAWHPPSLPMAPPYGHLPPEDYESQPRNEALDLPEQFTSELVPKTPAVDVQTSVAEGKNPAEVLIERSGRPTCWWSGHAGMEASSACCWGRSASASWATPTARSLSSADSRRPSATRRRRWAT